jgi:hypothetical protein
MRSPGARPRHVLLVGDFLHPLDRLAVQALLDGVVRHPGRRRGSVSMLLVGSDLGHVAGADHMDGPAPVLHPALARRHDEPLAERVRVPSRAGAGLPRCTVAPGFEPYRRLDLSQNERASETHPSALVPVPSPKPWPTPWYSWYSTSVPDLARPRPSSACWPEKRFHPGCPRPRRCLRSCLGELRDFDERLGPCRLARTTPSVRSPWLSRAPEPGTAVGNGLTAVSTPP